MVGGFGFILSNGALKKREERIYKKADSKEIKCGNNSQITDKSLKLLVFSSRWRLTWCLLMISLSLLDCFCSMSGDRKTIGRVRQLFFRNRKHKVRTPKQFIVLPDTYSVLLI